MRRKRLARSCMEKARPEHLHSKWSSSSTGLDAKKNKTLL
jgi:hypothetical protein